MNNKTLIKYFVLILLCGTLLRLYHLDSEPLWMDEGYTLQTITWEINGTADASTVLHRITTKESAPPLYYMMLYYWTRFTNTSAYNLRLPSVLFGILSLFIIYLIGKKIYSCQTGLIAMFLMAFSMSNIMFSQEARQYALFVFLALLSTYFFINFITEKKNWILYPIATAFLLYTHFFAFIAISLQVLVYLLWKEHFKPKYYEIGELIFVPVLLWLLCFPMHYHQIVRNIWWIKLIIAQQLKLLFLANYIVPISIVGALAGTALLVYIQRKYKILNKFDFIFGAKFFLVFFNAYVLLCIITSAFRTTPVFYIRFPLFLFPVFYVYFALMISRIKKNYLIVGLLLILSLGTLFLAYYKEDRKEQWDDVAQTIMENEKEGDIIFLIDAELKFLFNQYYNGGLNMVSASSTSNMTANHNIWGSVYSLTAAADRLWFVNSHNRRSGTFWQDNLDEVYVFKEHIDFNDIDLYIYEIPKRGEENGSNTMS